MSSRSRVVRPRRVSRAISDVSKQRPFGGRLEPRFSYRLRRASRVFRACVRPPRERSSCSDPPSAPEGPLDVLPVALPGSEEPRSACRREPVSPFPERRGHRSVSPYPEGHVELLTSGAASRGVILESLRSLGVRRPPEGRVLAAGLRGTLRQSTGPLKLRGARGAPASRPRTPETASSGGVTPFPRRVPEQHTGPRPLRAVTSS